MTRAPTHSKILRARSGWSTRILILVIAGIFFITLYPFRFDFTRHFSGALFPFSLDAWGKKSGWLDAFLNVLLFVPYGFAFAEKLRERGKSWRATLGWTFVAGAVLSYLVEFLQIWIPPRDSGWEDVGTNSFGSLVGAVLCILCGRAVFAVLSAAGRGLGAWLSWQRAILLLLLYMGLWFVFAQRLQKESRLSGWHTDALLAIGNSASNPFPPAWSGRIFALEFWDQAVSHDLAQKLSSQEPGEAFDPTPIVSYRFYGSLPFSDERHLLPDLSWTPEAPTSDSPNNAFLDGKSWLMSDGAVAALATAVERTGRFSLRVLCQPAQSDQVDAQIVSISSRSGNVNMELRQEDTKLLFWFRTPLSQRRARMSWTVPGAFAANEVANTLLSFDGSQVTLFINGKERGGNYELSAGAALARSVRRIKADELQGYQYIFCALVFVPAGCLLGVAWRVGPKHWLGRFCLMLALVLPAIFLEELLVHMSGRAVSFENIWLSIMLTVSGSLWINADCISRYRLQDKLRLAR
jgi:VanZ like family